MKKRLFFLLGVSMMILSIMVANNKGNYIPNKVISKQIGEYRSQIVLGTDSIVAYLTVWETDSFPPKLLSPCMRSIVQYTMCQPVMYSTDKRVYSAFYADVRLVIYKGNTSLTLELDYNINKWRLIDAKGKQICRHDLKNSELLSMMHELWPESKNINIKYEKFAE